MFKHLANPHYWILKLRQLFGYDPADVRVFAFEDHKVAYVLLPKAASTSIQTALAPFFGVEAQDGEEISRAMRSVAVKSSEFAKRIDGQDWFIFAVVRDPSNRAFSAYKNKLLEPKKIFRPLQRMGIRSRLGFAEFLEVLLSWPRGGLNDHFMPQTGLLKHVLGCDGLYLARLETFDEDWPKICAEAKARGLELPDLGWLNKTAQKPQAFSDVERARLGQLYAEDYDRFGYPNPA
ncbi:sulfotransferase family 2 domain-containing protein [Celeribacter litoreus]|uniref:sulfotransferase family 2 domain-containing protein n=1 Tax=Celeribacter litoreus TaxID=2876714 RepID=UPI001CCCF56A|nr:sulfotransferase family 2 domain-containing protein [Celeribacter litoreus]MCA0041904.1 sulfotransferase family protein [Celeribacter litoreus]